MATDLQPRTYTPEDLLTMPDGKHYELVDGELVETRMSLEAQWVTQKVARRIDEVAESTGIGEVFPEASNQCFPDAPERVCRPNVSFIRKGRLPPEQFQYGHCRIPPDLAVEVVSPGDLSVDVEHKVAEYLSAGVRLVWAFNPNARNVRVFSQDGRVRQLAENAELTGDDVVPGFHVRVGDLFPPQGLP